MAASVGSVRTGYLKWSPKISDLYTDFSKLGGGDGGMPDLGDMGGEEVRRSRSAKELLLV